MAVNHILAILIIFGLIASIFGKWMLIPVGVLVLLWLIRIGADIYWWYKDKYDRW